MKVINDPRILLCTTNIFFHLEEKWMDIMYKVQLLQMEISFIKSLCNEILIIDLLFCTLYTIKYKWNKKMKIEKAENP